MDLKKLEYILEIDRTGNVSDAARRLDVTPSALVQYLQKLEGELDVPLFHRAKGNWQATQSGRIYMDYAKQMLSIRQDTYRMINDFTSKQGGKISVAFPSGRGVEQFAQIYPEFHSRYPDVHLQPIELSVREQLDMLRGRELDVGMVCQEKPLYLDQIQYFDIAREDIMLVMPTEHPLCGQLKEPVDIRALEDEPFVVVSPQFTLRPIVDRIFQSAGVVPRILFESEHNPTIITMVQHGLCCGIVPAYYLYKEVPGIRPFRLSGRPGWHFSAACPRNIYLSKPIRALIDICAGMYQAHFKSRPHPCGTQ